MSVFISGAAGFLRQVPCLKPFSMASIGRRQEGRARRLGKVVCTQHYDTDSDALIIVGYMMLYALFMSSFLRMPPFGRSTYGSKASVCCLPSLHVGVSEIFVSKCFK